MVVLGKAAEQFVVGEKPWLRVYVCEHYEIFEFITEQQGQTVQLDRREFPIGETTSEFLYADLIPYFRDLHEISDELVKIAEGAGTKSSWSNVLNTMEKGADFHVFFWPLRQVVCEQYAAWVAGRTVDTNALTMLLPGYETLQRELMDFVSSCLNTENDEGRTALDRYISITGGTPLACPLAQGEAVFGKQTYHRKRNVGQYPVMVTPTEMMEGDLPYFLALTLYPRAAAELLQFLKYAYLKENMTFRPCKNCGRYFAVQGNGRSEYCGRPIAGSSRTCKQAGAMRIYESKKSENPALRAFSKSYKTHNARIRYGIMTSDQFKVWAVEARTMRDKCVSGAISLDELQTWMDKD